MCTIRTGVVKVVTFTLVVLWKLIIVVETMVYGARCTVLSIIIIVLYFLQQRHPDRTISLVDHNHSKCNKAERSFNSLAIIVESALNV